ncbi:hypothetical protein FRACYDRAFT_231875 [Fragilariopsis cylindrus CCMP1102]|uniref:Uncharacterized protein n=1 Tax=Fragilariopsis cylindrus CCMP1102 TaxID=635003 RepID=A0A1E7FU93_9STRA|nr:hypothetical protein FRACYDRAFT_231875 [Fragilariopsis cylindrus CCMP1102]|eukprot:OEU21731.1 hypothetical protein FRACYDRAFT_231875 [Fragilariopsis cylindrus CCMP1102]
MTGAAKVIAVIFLGKCLIILSFCSFLWATWKAKRFDNPPPIPEAVAGGIEFEVLCDLWVVLNKASSTEVNSSIGDKVVITADHATWIYGACLSLVKCLWVHWHWHATVYPGKWTTTNESGVAGWYHIYSVMTIGLNHYIGPKLKLLLFTPSVSQ